MKDSTESQLEELWIKDVEGIKVFAHEKRLEIMKLLKVASSVKDLSATLNLAPSKLYYHINLLEQHGFIRVIDRTFEGNLVEKIYQASAKQFKLVNPLIANDFPDESALALFASSIEASKEDFLRAFSDRNKDKHTPPRHPFFSKKAFKLSDAQLSLMHKKFDALIQEVTQLGLENEATENEAYELSLIFYKQGEES